MTDQNYSPNPPSATAVAVAPLKGGFSLLKFIFLTPLTLGIYPICAFARMAKTINRVASPHDGKSTMSYWLLFLIIAPLTLGLGFLFWFHRISARTGAELSRRGLPQSFGAGSFWGWHIFGILILIGPLVYRYKLCRAMNALVEDYNAGNP